MRPLPDVSCGDTNDHVKILVCSDATFLPVVLVRHCRAYASRDVQSRHHRVEPRDLALLDHKIILAVID